MTAIQSSDRQLEPGSFTRTGEYGTIPPTPQVEMDAAVADLQEHKDLWVTLDLDERIAILDQINKDLLAVGEEWVEAEIQAKSVQGNTFAEAEEWAILSYAIRNVRLLGESLRDLEKGMPPEIPGPVDRLPSGQTRARVFPVDRYDSLIFKGMTAEVWMQPGVSIDEISSSQARFYAARDGEGKVALVLGAGNTAMLIPADFLSKLFVEGSVVILKMNPVNAHMGPIMARAFRALIERHFLRIVYGGAEEGNYLCHHPDIDELHMTGSDKTFEAIVFGTGEAGESRKRQRQPLIGKPFSAELGNVTPVIIVPGPWSPKEIDMWGEKLVSWLIINAGFNCTTPRVIIQWDSWAHRHSLNRAVANTLAQVETRKAYYPGARERQQEFTEVHPDCAQLGVDEAERLPWTFITNVDPEDADNICFKNEAFCGLCAETALKAADSVRFLETAVRFANEQLWGNLAATLVVHPDSLKEPGVAAAVEQAVADLRYGTVLVNQYAPIGMIAMTTPWGAYPGNDFYDIQSGIGSTCNTLMFDSPQKTVIRSPFKISPDPLALNSRTALEVCRQLPGLQYQPSIGKMPGILWSAIRS